jgi:hypothetical protein
MAQPTETRKKPSVRCLRLRRSWLLRPLRGLSAEWPENKLWLLTSLSEGRHAARGQTLDLELGEAEGRSYLSPVARGIAASAAKFI